jgi:hypothetical protein
MLPTHAYRDILKMADAQAAADEQALLEVRACTHKEGTGEGGTASELCRLSSA